MIHFSIEVGFYKSPSTGSVLYIDLGFRARRWRDGVCVIFPRLPCHTLTKDPPLFANTAPLRNSSRKHFLNNKKKGDTKRSAEINTFFLSSLPSLSYNILTHRVNTELSLIPWNSLNASLRYTEQCGLFVWNESFSISLSLPTDPLFSPKWI